MGLLDVDEIDTQAQNFTANLFVSARWHASHYVLKAILPLIMIATMSFFVFWIDPIEAGTQIGMATMSMLTLIAYRFMVGSSIPIVPYLTRMDYFILGSTVLVFAALMQTVMTGILGNRARVETARRIDSWCQVFFPLAFSVIAVWSLII